MPQHLQIVCLNDLAAGLAMAGAIAELQGIRASLATRLPHEGLVSLSSHVHVHEVLQALDRALCYAPGGVVAVGQVRG